MRLTPDEREQRWEQRRARWALLRAVVPLLLVNAVAVGGQFAYGLEAYKVDGWPLFTTAVLALGAALTAESVSIYVNWHAHDSLLLRDTATAARRRGQAYLIAAVVASINYSHFSNGWTPTPLAVLTAGCSLLSPWLWGLHTRRAQRVQLLREGNADSAGATFSAERWRWFPRLTLGARRWSIFHGVKDPRAAWDGYIAEREAARAKKADEAAAGGAEASEPAPPSPRPPATSPSGPSARPASPGQSAPRVGRPPLVPDAEVWARVEKYTRERGPIPNRRTFREVTGVKGERGDALYRRYMERRDTSHLHVVTGGVQ
jgi:hypothetical protein